MQLAHRDFGVGHRELGGVDLGRGELTLAEAQAAQAHHGQRGGALQQAAAAQCHGIEGRRIGITRHQELQAG
ncbi:hypothetical protein D3C72_1707540 [compost metagenome]